jgi:hypothetical protein
LATNTPPLLAPPEGAWPGSEIRLPEDPGFHQVVAWIHGLCAAVADWQSKGMAKEDIRTLLDDARSLHATSPFIAHLQTWPRGYPGDFEAIDCILNATNRAVPGTLGYHLEQYALTSAIAQQHRNKVQRQARLILDTVVQRLDSETRILSIACGASPDLCEFQSILAQYPCEFVLLDADADALEASRTRLHALSDRITLIHRNVFQRLASLRRVGPFDLVLAGGLFDYLPDRQAEFLARTIVDQLLKPHGAFFFTNIAQGNPFRYWIDFLANWTLIERSEDEVRGLLTHVISPVATTVEQDSSGLTLLAHARLLP